MADEHVAKRKMYLASQFSHSCRMKELKDNNKTLFLGLLASTVYSFHCSCHTSLISFIFEPPFPMREPHWLAGTTSLRVTGGLLVAGLLLMELIMS